MLWRELVDRLTELIGQADGHSPEDVVRKNSQVLRKMQEVCLKEGNTMLWRGIELSTFDVETLRGWIADLEGEKLTILAEIDGREETDPPTVRGPIDLRPLEEPGKIIVSTDRGHPPRRDEGEGQGIPLARIIL